MELIAMFLVCFALVLFVVGFADTALGERLSLGFAIPGAFLALFGVVAALVTWAYNAVSVGPEHLGLLAAICLAIVAVASLPVMAFNTGYWLSAHRQELLLIRLR